MKKILKILSIIVCAIVMCACTKNDKQSITNKIYNKINSSKGYQIQATMELINNENSYKYDVLMSYKKDDNFRVSLKNQTNNHEQIILKNEEGVYVLTPTLNKSFKFQSKWPYNNSQAYLPQSIINDIKSDSNSTMKKLNNGYLFTSKVNYKNNALLTHQEVLFDKNLVIKKVTVYNEEETPQIIVNFKTQDMNAKFNKDYFVLENNMKESNTSKQSISQLEEAIYPMYLPDGTYLDTEKTIKLDEGSRIILTFSGDNPFMLVEETSKTESETAVIPTAGDIDIFGDGIAIIDDTTVSWSSAGIDYYLVSNNLSKNDLITVARSIATLPVGK